MSQGSSHWWLQPWVWMVTSCSLLAVGALGAWRWLLLALPTLPSPRSEQGETLLYHYNRTSHDIFLALLGIVVLGLLWWSRRDASQSESQPPRPWPRQLIGFARHHPVVLVVFIAYAVAMINGTNWLFPELVGWYDGVIDHHLLDNFSIRHDFISETMLRNDYRFFPLAHQDLHVLSWLTAYVKIWMLVSAAELFAIILLAHRLIRRLTPAAPAPGLLLIISLLLLSAPATGFAFFQLIYAERMLTLCFIAFSSCYLEARTTGNRRSQALAVVFAVIGMFFKEVGVLLFVTPAACLLLAGAAGRLPNTPGLPWRQLLQRGRWRSLGLWLQAYQLELWICSLLVIFPLAYAYLSYLPSLYHGKQAYDSNDALQWVADPRCWIPLTYGVIRVFRLLTSRTPVQLLDGLNLAALSYAAALYVLVGYEGSSYMALPVQLVAVLDVAFAWSTWIAPRLSRSLGSAGGAALVGVAGCGVAIALEQQADQSFLQRVSTIKTKQASWLKTMQRIDDFTVETRRSGEDVNLIFTRSWFRKKRHLDRFHYDRLIYLDPTSHTYTVVDGIDKGAAYQPKTGDLLINIDKGGLGFLGPTLESYETIFRYSDEVRNGRIYRYRGPKEDG